MQNTFRLFLISTLVCTICSNGFGFTVKPVSLESPDKKIRYAFEIRNGKPGYLIFYKDKKLVDFSFLNLIFKGDSLEQGVRLEKQIRLDSAAHYKLMTGRSAEINDSFREIKLFLKEINSPGRSVCIQVRAFNDGIAFRYLFPESGRDSLFLRKEITGFNITGNPYVHALVQDDYLNAHEGNYLHRSYLELPKDSLMDMPMLFEYPENIFLSITEAALLDYAGMYLNKSESGLISNLSPRLDHSGFAVISGLPHESPWRVCLISDRIGRFLETNLITDLAPPCRIKDLSWLKPGKTTFPWWNGNVTADTLNAPGNNFVTQQYYIDFCARSKIEYHSVVEYGLHQWYQDDGISFMPGPNSNVLKPMPGLDMKQVCDYAHSKGIGIRVWVHWAALYPKLDSAFTLFEQWGISGMMIDFLNRDDQEMVNIQTEMLQKAAVHHLHIQFHGAYKPTGLSRTYPNEFTREGTLNYEADKWNPLGVPPNHDLDVAFTRLIAGSTDYHLGGFRAVVPEKFRAQYTRPLVLGTRSHMLAMYLILENANAMVCDYPEAYEGQPGFEFLQYVPTTWDETHVLLAQSDHYLVIARKKNKDWWVGGVNNDQERTLDVPMDWLGSGEWKISIFQDDLNAPFNPNGILSKTMLIRITDQITGKGSGDPQDLKIPLAKGGGFTFHIEKQ